MDLTEHNQLAEAVENEDYQALEQALIKINTGGNSLLMDKSQMLIFAIAYRKENVRLWLHENNVPITGGVIRKAMIMGRCDLANELIDKKGTQDEIERDKELDIYRDGLLSHAIRMGRIDIFDNLLNKNYAITRENSLSIYENAVNRGDLNFLKRLDELNIPLTKKEKECLIGEHGSNDLIFHYLENGADKKNILKGINQREEPFYIESSPEIIAESNRYYRQISELQNCVENFEVIQLKNQIEKELNRVDSIAHVQQPVKKQAPRMKI